MTRLISDGLDRRLSWFERLMLGIHLLGCWPCRRFRRALRWLHTALPAAPTEAQLSPESRARIQQALDRAADER
jgi:hypothetical protein